MPARGLVERIDALLPQTQCRRCGYPSCLGYARALAAGSADLDRCPPGGEATVVALAHALDRPSKPLDPSCGEPGPWRVARIVERDCIGCTLCIRACPVDAIVGASRRMHTVIESRCTGCELCVAPCPVDCIALEPLRWPGGTAPVGADFVAWWMRTRAHGARRDHHARRARLASTARKHCEPRRRAVRGLTERREEIRAAVARVRARRVGARSP